MRYHACVEPTDNPGEWQLIRPLAIFDFTVPAGFKTDGASIPWGFQWLIKPGGRLFAPAILHDFFYRTGKVPRVTADAFFLKAMEYNGVGWAKRKVVYVAVRSFGWIFYKRGQA